jgi:LEA14-like dessication related protein
MRHLSSSFPVVIAMWLLAACAALTGYEPLQVNVVGVEPLDGQGLEMRMLVKLRVQNPNDAPLDYDGVFLRLDVQGSTFASGVSDERGTVPRFGEAVIAVPVTVSAMNIVRQALGFMAGGQPPQKINYNLEGRLNSPTFGSTRFQSQGELALPPMQ